MTAAYELWGVEVRDPTQPGQPRTGEEVFSPNAAVTAAYEP